MDKLEKSNLKLGIIAGGQLGKMLIWEASKWDINTYVLDPESTCPASPISSVFIQGNYLNYDDVYNFGKNVDIITFEIENINTEALKKLQSEGVEVIPDPTILDLIQDKGLQKQFYLNNAIPTSAFELLGSKQAIIDALNEQKLNYPFVQKIRKGGFDGRGVAVINSKNELNLLLEGDSLIEEKISIDKEIAVIVARNKDGETACFPAVDAVYNEKANLVEKLICPSSISIELASRAEELAIKIANKMNMVGLLAVEFFIDKSGELLVNEVAPRTHNSGHHTLESVVTSQFEQQLRAILNLPLGSTQLKMNAVMVNILGGEGYEGPVEYEGIKDILKISGVNLHLYGKKYTRPYRKMGHVTILANTAEEALRKADIVLKTIKVKSWDKK